MTTSLSSYSGLQAAIAEYLGRSDLTTTIPAFITLAEAKFNRDLEVRQMEARSTTVVDTTSTAPEFISLPTNFLSMRWIRLNGVTGKPHLDFLSAIQMAEYRSGIGNGSGQPKYYSLLVSDIELCPQPDSNYTLEMVYRIFVPALSDTNTSNWLLALAPDAYLYGSLLESYLFNQNDDRLPVWKAAYNEAIEGLRRLNMSSAFSGGPLAIRTTGYNP